MYVSKQKITERHLNITDILVSHHKCIQMLLLNFCDGYVVLLTANEIPEDLISGNYVIRYLSSYELGSSEFVQATDVVIRYDGELQCIIQEITRSLSAVMSASCNKNA